MAAIGMAISGAAVQVKIGQGKLKGIFCSSAAATPTITVYNSGAALTTDPTIIPVFTPVGATMYRFDDDGIGFSKGLYIALGGTVTGTAIYE